MTIYGSVAVLAKRRTLLSVGHGIKKKTSWTRNYSEGATTRLTLTCVINRPELFALPLHACVTILFAYDRRGWLFTRIVIPRRAVG